MDQPRRVLHLILCWHMHQPDYRHHDSREFVLPWTYLHATKDYTDMAWHLEQNPGMRAVVNFVPILLEQLEDYAEQFRSGTIRDPLLRLLAREDLSTATPAERDLILDRCFRCNHTSMIEPYPAYRQLRELFRQIENHGRQHFDYLSPQYLADLLTWYHLSWMGETVRRSTELVPRLMSQGALFSHTDRLQLFELIGDLIAGVIPRYRRLAEEGRIELSTTPYYHPIAPLLMDFKSAREAWPEALLPECPAYPGGTERLAFHIDAARASHQRRFGRAASGMWPAEGAISQAVVLQLARHGVSWAASGEGVLVNSLRATGKPLPQKRDYMYRPYQVQDETGELIIRLFFRDDRLSDLIGFEYGKWFARDAVNHFVAELEQIYHQTEAHESPVVSVILDGENAWEYYPYNGYYFLSELYAALAEHPFIRPTTFSDYLAQCTAQSTGASCAVAGQLPRVVAGSWVYGTLSTWIGSPEKNRAWDLMCSAKTGYDLVMARGGLTEERRQAAARQLADCESSDWFWWFGDYNPAASVASFDRLFRDKLANLYRLLDLPVPAALDHPISAGHAGGAPGVEAGGTMRRGS
ncbi:glycoside hydrolase family 57 protein [Thiobacter aerophilum]|uniref:Glycoside hydrolase family 57 protein n=1 Tax=Thiobacter aerophilum TaxID=3121275 RepID=A0ABV0EJX2_9BURK